MDFHLTAEQRMLVNTAREFFQHQCPTTLVQQLALDERGFSDDLWRHVSAMGWPGLLIPTTQGGSEGTVLDVVLLVEEMGRACFPSPFIQSAVVCTWLMLTAGNQAQQQRLLPAMARGERLCTLALTEESAAFTPEALAMRGEVGGRLHGSKLFVKDAHVASELLVVARGGSGFNLLVLERERPGMTLYPLETLSGEKLFEVAFTDVPVHEADLLGPPGLGWEALASTLQLGALARSAEQIGGAQRILEICVEYAKIREQSGRPIGAFQAIQHHCAELLRRVEGSRYALYQAAWQMQEGQDCAHAVAVAKAYASEACLWVARQGHQILGAIGYCEEHPLHLYHKRIHAAGLDFGDAAHHLETVAQGIGLV